MGLGVAMAVRGGKDGAMRILHVEDEKLQYAKVKVA
jgi:hypothetical protein